MRAVTPDMPVADRGAPGLPPGPRLPVVVQSAQWTLGSASFLDRCRERYGSMFTLRLLPKAAAGPGAGSRPRPWVFLADPAHIRQVFTADPRVVRTGDTNRFLEPLVGPRSILVSDEPRHGRQRALLMPPLHGERLRAYAALMSDVAAAEVARWPVREPFALWPRMQAITLEVIVRAVFGIPGPEAVSSATASLGSMLNRMTSPRWLLSRSFLASIVTSAQKENATRRLVEPVEAVIRTEIARRRDGSDISERDDIVSLLMRAEHEDGSPVSDQELRDELMTLLIAGHESTATALAWAFEMLLRHPDKVGRLREETATGQDDYAAAVAQETLRLRPVVPFVLRNLAAPMELGGHELPAGTWLAPCGYLVNRSSDVYPDPLRFAPERFLEHAPGASTWLPFGGGVRRCLGASFAQLEMRRVLQAVLAHADLAPASPDPEPIRSRFITLAPRHGARVVLTGRRS